MLCPSLALLTLTALASVGATSLRSLISPPLNIIMFDVKSESPSGLEDYYEVYSEEDKTEIHADVSSPPPHTEVARMARYVCHQSNWTAMATLSSRAPGVGAPFANIFSVSDGTVGESTGTPYLYMSAWELSSHDLVKDNRASLTMSLAQTQYCAVNNLDPEDPRCAHVIFSGDIVKLADDSEEADIARKALFTRHPEMSGWPKNHEWFFAKLNIMEILVLDYFGGAKKVPVEDYYAATPY